MSKTFIKCKMYNGEKLINIKNIDSVTLHVSGEGTIINPLEYTYMVSIKESIGENKYMTTMFEITQEQYNELVNHHSIWWEEPFHLRDGKHSI